MPGVHPDQVSPLGNASRHRCGDLVLAGGLDGESLALSSGLRCLSEPKVKADGRDVQVRFHPTLRNAVFGTTPGPYPEGCGVPAPVRGDAWYVFLLPPDSEYLRDHVLRHVLRPQRNGLQPGYGWGPGPACGTCYRWKGMKRRSVNLRD